MQLRSAECTMYFIFFFKQKTAYEMRISDWSSDVCSSDLYSRYLTSDQDLSRVSTALAKHLGVDEFAAMNDLKRPDLVFVMSDAGVPHRINVIELKSP